ncbi:MAG: class I SAM-dependent methyltransferase [Gemmatimonadales bacterium]
MRLIAEAAPDHDAFVLDVGGGPSTVVDGLLRLGYRHVGVLDLSRAALAHSQARLGSTTAQVTWYEADILTVDLPAGGVDVWHDRAVFHFLTDPADRDRYITQVRRSVRPGGHVLVATFGEDGPTRCSGLEVARYSPESLHSAFGPEFRLLKSIREDHLTPTGAHQGVRLLLVSLLT